MTDQQNTAPAVWDPTARGGAGGWVRGPQQPATPGAPPTAPPAAPGPTPGSPAGPPPQSAGPYDEDAPTAFIPQPVPPRPDAPGAFPPRSAPQQQAPYGPPRPAQQPPYPPQAQPQPGYGQAAPYGQAPYGAPGRPPYDPAQQGYAQPGRPRPEYAQPEYPGDGYAGPDYPTSYEAEDDEGPGNRRAPLLIAFALLFVLALGGGILWAVKDKGSGTDQAGPASPSATATGDTSGSGNPQPAPAPTGAAPTPTAPDPAASTGPSPSPTGAGANAPTQAKALDELLTQGESAKAPIGNAVAKVNSCPTKPDIESAAQVFDSGAKQRDQLLAKLAQLSVTDLPGGPDAVQSLKSAWQLSADIDRAYATWARTVASQGCSGSAPNTADKKRADELNPQATQAKKDFVTKWKAIADQFGLTPRTQDRI
ncbi:hypothetical protein OG401_13370 [Kitasatospora purpeofusca]|uniref:hypothetical protein n=1 Tax=Kitasatospora purpeofusca TaxID=67352 RepID=UPI00224CA46D|nr:hypothetical protein [Kitasatospora purpeofusca]MCX4685292.1 hypothetical protein [Kitasatospora purpeofusca]